MSNPLCHDFIHETTVQQRKARIQPPPADSILPSGPSLFVLLCAFVAKMSLPGPIFLSACCCLFPILTPLRPAPNPKLEFSELLGAYFRALRGLSWGRTFPSKQKHTKHTPDTLEHSQNTQKHTQPNTLKTRVCIEKNTQNTLKHTQFLLPPPQSPF